MDRYTNSYYRSARHRVLTTDKDRYSVAFFLNGNMKLDAPVLDGSGGRVMVGEQIRQRAAATFAGKLGDVLKGSQVHSDDTTFEAGVMQSRKEVAVN